MLGGFKNETKGHVGLHSGFQVANGCPEIVICYFTATAPKFIYVILNNMQSFEFINLNTCVYS